MARLCARDGSREGRFLDLPPIGRVSALPRREEPEARPKAGSLQRRGGQRAGAQARARPAPRSDGPRGSAARRALGVMRRIYRPNRSGRIKERPPKEKGPRSGPFPFSIPNSLLGGERLLAVAEELQEHHEHVDEVEI